MDEAQDAPEPIQDIESDLSHLAAIDSVLGRRNLLTTLPALARYSFLVDRWFPIPYEEVFPHRGRVYLADREAALRESIRPFILPYLAMIAIVQSNPHLTRDMEEVEFLKCINHFTAYSPPILAGGTDDSLDSFYIRLASQQFPYQHPWWSHLSSASFIFGHEQAGSEFSMRDAVQRVIGVSYDELVEMCICLYFTFRTSRGKPLPMFPWTGVPRFTKEKGDAVLRALSQTQVEYRKKYAAHRNADEKLRVYDFNPLFDRPVIRVGREYYAPIPSLIPAWAADGLVYRLLDHYGNGAFTDALGHALEAYVADILSKSGREYVGEQIIPKRKGEGKTADFIVIEGDKALILDCKTRRFALKARYGEQSAIDHEFEESLVKGLRQCFATAQLIREGKLDSPRFRDIRAFTYAVVTLDDYHLANAVSLVSNDDMAPVVKGRYHVLSGDEFEMMLAELSGESLISFMQGKLENPRSAGQSFSDYMIETLPGKCPASTVDRGLKYVKDLVDRMAGTQARL